MRAATLVASLATLVIVPASAEPSAAPTTADVVAGAQACAVKSMSEAKMLARLFELGWMKTASRNVPGLGNLTLFSRNGVQLSYFHAKEMKQCVVKVAAQPSIAIDGLVAELSTLFDKQPKIEEAGKRYLYFLPRLDILTLQVKDSPAGSTIELSVVH